jgi:flagellar basal-body rod protein FlgF
MGDLFDIAVSILAQSEQRVEISAENLANSTTPGFKRRVAFSKLLKADSATNDFTPTTSRTVDVSPGKLVASGNAFDLAIARDGFFSLRLDNEIVFSRAGQFQRDRFGRLVSSRGEVLQSVSGNDVIVTGADVEIRANGAIIEDGLETDRIAVFVQWGGSGEPLDTSGSMVLTDSPEVRQGFYEASNVSTGDEMVSMIESLRRAEAGQRVILTYDELMGRAITTFSEATR